MCEGFPAVRRDWEESQATITAYLIISALRKAIEEGERQEESVLKVIFSGLFKQNESTVERIDGLCDREAKVAAGGDKGMSGISSCVSTERSRLNKLSVGAAGGVLTSMDCFPDVETFVTVSDGGLDSKS